MAFLFLSFSGLSTKFTSIKVPIYVVSTGNIPNFLHGHEPNWVQRVIQMAFSKETKNYYTKKTK